MSYTENGDTITLQVSREDYDRLLLALGMAAACARRDLDESAFWSLIDLANRLNTGNPRFTEYEIPEEFKPDADRP